MSRYRIAAIPGDGIGKEVMPEGIRVLEAVASRFNLKLDFDHFEFASCDYYLKHGDMLPPDWVQQTVLRIRLTLLFDRLWVQ